MRFNQPSVDQSTINGDNDGGVSANDALELEFMRKEDSSWHPCQVSLCGVGLKIDYGHNDFKDTIVKKEEAFTCLRVRSVPLQGDDCLKIQQGDHVLATQQSQSKSLFFDAEVEKVLRVRHSKRTHCRCTFAIKWLHQELKETLVVSSSSIRLLVTGNIMVHPTISALVNAVKTLTSSYISPCLADVNNMDDDMDVHEFLEKQIEEISSAADVYKNKITEHMLRGVEVGLKENVQLKTASASKSLHIQQPSDHTQKMRCTRSRNKQRKEIEIKNPSQVAPSIGEKLTESRSYLSPLAARAALASLISQLPQNLEFSSYLEEGKSLSNSADITTNKEVTVKASTGSKFCISSDVSNTCMRDKHASDIGDASVLSVLKTDTIVKSLFSQMKPNNPQLLDSNSGVLVKELGDEDNTPEVVDSHSGLTCSTKEKNLSQPTRRVTRSTAQISSRISDDNINKKISGGEKNITLSTNRGRLTRYKVHKEEFQNIASKNVMEDATPVEHSKSKFSEEIVKSQGSYVLKDQNTVASQITGDELHPNKEYTKLVMKDVSKRLTRSAIRMKSGDRTTEVTPVPPVVKQNELFEQLNKNISQRHLSGLLINVLETKEPTPSPLYAEISSPLTEGTKDMNKRRKSHDSKPPQKTEENVIGNVESTCGQKKPRKSNEQELRFSPRLRFLPRTCSHVQS